MDAVTLGPLAGADRTAVAAHYVALARHFYGLAQVLDPTVKVPKPQGRKRKHDEDEGADKPPKKKRENTAYTQYIKDTLPQFRKEHPTLNNRECMAAVAGAWKTSKLNPKVNPNAPKPPSNAMMAAAAHVPSAGGEEDEAARAARKAAKKAAKREAKANAAAEAGGEPHKHHKHHHHHDDE